MSMNSDPDQHVSVRVENFDEMTAKRTIEVEPEHFVLSTYQVQAGNAPQGTGAEPYQRILAQDPLRKEAVISAIDQPIVLAHSEAQAANANNQTALVPFPEGYYLPVGMTITLQGTGQVWAVATSVTIGRVSVAVNRRGV
jgi:hypothetical protein